jgi:hypothetical protein
VDGIRTLEDVPGPKGVYTLPYIGMMLLSRSLGKIKENHVKKKKKKKKKRKKK